MFRNLRRRRQQLGLSLEEVARRVGASVATLSRVERGLVRLTPELADALANVLNVDVAGEKSARRLSQAAIAIREALGQAVLEDVCQGADIKTGGWRPSNYPRTALKELIDRGEVVIHGDTVKLKVTHHPAVREAEEICAYREAKLADEAILQKTYQSLDQLWKMCQDPGKHPPLLLVGLHEMLRLTVPVIVLQNVTRPIPLSPNLVGNSLAVWTGRGVSPSEGIGLITELNLNRTRSRWEAALAVLPAPEGEKALRDLWARMEKEAGLLLAGLWVAAVLIEDHSALPSTVEARGSLWAEIEGSVHRALNLPSAILDRLWEQLPDMDQAGTWITLPEEW